MNQKMAADRERQLEILQKVTKEAERFFAQRETGKALPIWERQPLRHISDEGLGAEGAMDLFVKEYSKGLALNSGSRFFGFVIGGVTPAALAGDWMTSLYDQNAFGEIDCMDRQIEDEAIEGLKELLGLRSDFLGSFTSGATMATTNALACAREWAAVRQGKTANDGIYGLERPVVLSAFAHASIYKGLSILGLGRNSIIEYGKLPGRDRGDVAKLEAELEKARGKAVIVIANMGTASSGDLDDLRAIADLKKKYPFWLHVDAAVGSLAMATPKYRGLYDGVEEADSITIDGHKWLNMNYDCAIALVRREHREMQYRIYAQATRVNDSWTEATPFEHLGNEGSRRFRALAVWMNLMAYGKEGFCEMAERDCAMAAALADKLEASGVYKVHRPVLINGFAFTLNKAANAGAGVEGAGASGAVVTAEKDAACAGGVATKGSGAAEGCVDANGVSESGACKAESTVTAEEMIALERAIREDGTTYLNRADVCGVPHLRCSFSNWSIEEKDVEQVAEALIRIGRKFV